MGDTADADAEGGLPQGEVFTLGRLHHSACGPLHDAGQLLVDPLLFPTELLDVLSPLKIGDDDPSCVDQKVWQHEDAALPQEEVGGGGVGVVGGLDHHPWP